MRSYIVIAVFLGACGGASAPADKPVDAGKAPEAAAAAGSGDAELDAFAAQLRRACVESCTKERVGEGMAAEEAGKTCEHQCDPENSPLKALVPANQAAPAGGAEAAAGGAEAAAGGH